MNEDDARLTPDEEDELVDAVLRRTTGAACSRAEELLCERQSWSFAPHLSSDVQELRPSDVQELRPSDVRELRPSDAQELQPPDTRDAGPLDADDRALLEAHLEHCPACAALARNLAVLRATLPSFASLDPGPSFTAQVLAATSRAQPATLADRLSAWLRPWLSRPRFALEAAYVCTLLLVLAVGNPAATLQAASNRTVTAAAEGLDRAREAWPTAVAKVTATPQWSEGVRALDGVAGGVVERRSAVAGGLAGALDRALARWSAAWGWLRGVAWELAGSVSSAWEGVREVVSGWVNRPATEPGARRAR